MEDSQTEKEKYQEQLACSSDDELFVVSFFKINKIGYELAQVREDFYDGDIESYEALTKFEALLALTDDIRQEIKKRL